MKESKPIKPDESLYADLKALCAKHGVRKLLAFPFWQETHSFVVLQGPEVPGLSQHEIIGAIEIAKMRITRQLNKTWDEVKLP